MRDPDASLAAALAEAAAGQSAIWIGNVGNLTQLWDAYRLPGPAPIEYGPIALLTAGDGKEALELFKTIEQPCFAYKIFAAGRKDPRESFEEVARYLKPVDGVNIGMYPPDSPTIVEDNVALASELLPRASTVSR